jgi:hypothetical protein
VIDPEIDADLALRNTPGDVSHRAFLSGPPPFKMQAAGATFDVRTSPITRADREMRAGFGEISVE